MATNKSVLYSVDPAQAKDYTFHSFDNLDAKKTEIREITFGSLGLENKVKGPEYQEIIKKERAQAENSEFTINPIVRQYRGILDQVKSDQEKFIIEQVEKKVRKVKEDAFQQGYQEGLQRGHEEVVQKTIGDAEAKIEILEAMIQHVLGQQEAILKNQKDELYKLIRTLTKWVILRELKDDGQYITRLLEKLVSEIGTRDHLLIQVGRDAFEKMPEVLQVVESKLGKLTSVRYEIDDRVSEHGIVVESLNSIIKGRLEDQFKNLDQLFESVGIVGEDSTMANVHKKNSES